jgi:predicted nucleic acid-binding protein
MKIFFDTNVLIAAFIEEHEHHARALPALESVHEKSAQGVVSAHTLLELYATLTRLPRSPRVQPRQAMALIDDNILKSFTIISLSAKEYGELVLRLGKQGTIGGQAYDALHIACAEKSGADRIYTFNARHFQSIAEVSWRARIVSP